MVRDGPPCERSRKQALTVPGSVSCDAISPNPNGSMFTEFPGVLLFSGAQSPHGRSFCQSAKRRPWTLGRICKHIPVPDSLPASIMKAQGRPFVRRVVYRQAGNPSVSKVAVCDMFTLEAFYSGVLGPGFRRSFRSGPASCRVRPVKAVRMPAMMELNLIDRHRGS